MEGASYGRGPEPGAMLGGGVCASMRAWKHIYIPGIYFGAPDRAYTEKQIWLETRNKRREEKNLPAGY